MKLLFTDLDGTLLNNDSQVSPGTKAFLDDFLQAGNKLILSSGRPLLSILEVKEKAGLTQPGIFFQIPWIAGQIFVRPKLHWIYKNADYYAVIVLSGCIDQAFMAFMQITHCRYKAYRKAGLFPFSHVLSDRFYFTTYLHVFSPFINAACFIIKQLSYSFFI